MKQPVKKSITSTAKPKKKPLPKQKRPTHKHGISKLEDRFAKDFLDKAGYDYVRQFEAKDIKRFYDFAVKAPNGAIVLLEIDGDYFHGLGLKHDEKSPMQKKNERVDKLKDDWAHLHGIPLIRIWEHDINDNPPKVRKLLEEKIGDAYRKQDKKNEMAKRH